MTVRIWPVLTGIEMKSSKSIAFNTKVARAGSGKKRTCTNQILPLWTISVKFVHLTAANSKEIIGFVSLLRGAHEPFFGKIRKIAKKLAFNYRKIRMAHISAL